MFSCKYCNQRYADTDKCCEFCGAPLPTIERATFSPEKVVDTVSPFPSRRIDANSTYAIHDVSVEQYGLKIVPIPPGIVTHTDFSKITWHDVGVRNG